MEMPITYLRSRLEHLLSIDQESKPQVYLQVFDAAEIANLNYWLELLLSAGIATLAVRGESVPRGVGVEEYACADSKGA